MKEESEEFQTWKRNMRNSIMAAAIVRQCFDMMAEGRGEPKADDMRRFSDEAEAIAQLWAESLPTDEELEAQLSPSCEPQP